MIEISSAPSFGGGSSNPTGWKKATPSDYETFLTMLTTQLENQDPLDPVESQDLAVQLATFSGVEQQTLTNELLSQLSQALGAGSMSEMSNWIGREVLSDELVSFSGAPIEVEFGIPDQATSAELIVLDSNDREVQRLTVPLAEHLVSHTVTRLFYQFKARLHADITHNQQFFKLFPEFLGNLVLLKECTNLTHKPRTSLG